MTGTHYIILEGDREITPFPTTSDYEIASISPAWDNETFLLCTLQNGIVIFNPKAATKEEIYVPLDAQSQDMPFYVIVDKNTKDIWYTSDETLKHYRRNPDGTYSAEELEAFPASQKYMLNEIIPDNHGHFWVSAFDSPSFIISQEDEKPLYYSMNKIRDKFNANPAIIAMTASEPGYLWISQERSGVCLYDSNADEIFHYADNWTTRRLPLLSTKEIIPSKDGSAWIAPEFTPTAYRLSHKGNQIVCSDSVILDYSEYGNIKQLLEDKDGNLWIGTTQALLKRHIGNPNTIETISRTNEMISDIRESIDGTIWASTVDGNLFRIDTKSNISSYPTNMNITSIATATNGCLWIGTEAGGIYRFSPKTKQIENFSQLCGASGNRINCLYSDDYGHLWILTNPMITEYNPNTSSTFIYRTGENGMPWRLLPTTFAVDNEQGILYFGGIPGICTFKPSTGLDREAPNVRTTITNIVSYQGESLIIDPAETHLFDTTLKLSPAHRDIDIQFSTFHHLNAPHIRYAYKLDGVDEDWHYTEPGENVARYRRIPPGTHLFQVKASDQDGLWSDEITTLMIDRKPSFTESWWTRSAFTFLVLCFIAYITISWIKRSQKKNEEIWADSTEMMRMRDYLLQKDKSDSPEETSLDQLLLQKITQTVKDNLSQSDFNVDALGRCMGMSRSTLTRKLKAIAGCTPLDFIRNAKMERARELLSDPARNVSEVADALGYYDRKYFTSCFKAVHGVTPSDFQKQQAKPN